MKRIKIGWAYLCEIGHLMVDAGTQTVRVRVGDRIERVGTPFNFSDLDALFGEGNWKLLGPFEASFNADKLKNTDKL